MSRYQSLAVVTNYWKPGTNFLNEIVEVIEEKVVDNDFVVVSEKALSTAQGKIVNESMIQPNRNAKFIAQFWMRFCWGYIFSTMLNFGQYLTQNLRQYPLDTGSKHKQLALERAGLVQALMFGSEGAIDGSNLPYSYVSLPLNNVSEVANQIRKKIEDKLKKNVIVIIVDTDKTYSFRNFHFTSRPKPMQNIHGNGGVVTYFIGRMLRLKKRPTPLSIAGLELSADEALLIANIADRARGTGSGTTVWKMAKRFHVNLTDVTWNMLSNIEHKPIVIVRRRLS